MCHRGRGPRCHALLSLRPAAAARVGRAPACWALGPPPAPALLPAVTCACRRVLRAPGRGWLCPSRFCPSPAFSRQCRRGPAMGAPGLPQAGSRGLGIRASCCLVFLFQDKASSLVVEALGNALVERGPRGWPCARCRPSPAGGSPPASLTPRGGRAPGSCPPPWQRLTRACRLGAPVGCTLTGGGRARPDVDPGCEVGPSRVCSSCPARAPVTALWAEGSCRSHPEGGPAACAVPSGLLQVRGPWGPHGCRAPRCPAGWWTWEDSGPSGGSGSTASRT